MSDDEEDEEGGGGEEDAEAYMAEQKEKLEQEKNAIMNDHNLIAEVYSIIYHIVRYNSRQR